MKLLAIHLGKVSWLAETAAFDPKGKLFLPDFLASITALAEFRVAPDKSGQYREKGAVFEVGKLGGQRIDKLSIFNDGFVIETGSPTEDTEACLRDLMLWAKEVHGLKFDPEIVKRKMYYSRLVAFMDIDLDDLNPILKKMGQPISDSVSATTRVPSPYRTAGVYIDVNTLTRKYPPGPFSVERKLDSPDDDNKYFCSAPLETNKHLELLEQFEAALKQ
jgi:hypothetical protein